MRRANKLVFWLIGIVFGYLRQTKIAMKKNITMWLAAILLGSAAYAQTVPSGLQVGANVGFGPNFNAGQGTILTVTAEGRYLLNENLGVGANLGLLTRMIDIGFGTATGNSFSFQAVGEYGLMVGPGRASGLLGAGLVVGDFNPSLYLLPGVNYRYEIVEHLGLDGGLRIPVIIGSGDPSIGLTVNLGASYKF
jgi:hypothetical protein